MVASLLPTALVLAASLVQVVLGQHHALYECPAMKPIEDFQSNRFFGDWYVYKQYKVGVEQSMECKTLKLGPDGSLEFDFSVRGNAYTVEGDYLVDSDNKGIIRALFDYSDVLGSTKDGEVIWSIQATDYESFAILSACQNEGYIHKQYVYILSREQQPTEYQKAVMDMEYKNAHFPKGASLEVQKHQECSESVPEDAVVKDIKQDKVFVKNKEVLKTEDEKDSEANYVDDQHVTKLKNFANQAGESVNSYSGKDEESPEMGTTKFHDTQNEVKYKPDSLKFSYDDEVDISILDSLLDLYVKSDEAHTSDYERKPSNDDRVAEVNEEKLKPILYSFHHNVPGEKYLPIDTPREEIEKLVGGKILSNKEVESDSFFRSEERPQTLPEKTQLFYKEAPTQLNKPSYAASEEDYSPFVEKNTRNDYLIKSEIKRQNIEAKPYSKIGFEEIQQRTNIGENLREDGLYRVENPEDMFVQIEDGIPTFDEKVLRKTQQQKYNNYKTFEEEAQSSIYKVDQEERREEIPLKYKHVIKTLGYKSNKRPADLPVKELFNKDLIEESYSQYMDQDFHEPSPKVKYSENAHIVDHLRNEEKQRLDVLEKSRVDLPHHSSDFSSSDDDFTGEEEHYYRGTSTYDQEKEQSSRNYQESHVGLRDELDLTVEEPEQIESPFKNDGQRTPSSVVIKIKDGFALIAEKKGDKPIAVPVTILENLFGTSKCKELEEKLEETTTTEKPLDILLKTVKVLPSSTQNPEEADTLTASEEEAVTFKNTNAMTEMVDDYKNRYPWLKDVAISTLHRTSQVQPVVERKWKKPSFLQFITL